MAASIRERICAACQALTPLDTKDDQDEIDRRLRFVGAHVTRGEGEAD